MYGQMAGFVFKEWYQEHGSDLNEGRRKRYATDPEYKAQILARNREARASQREDRKALRREERKASSLKLGSSSALKHTDVPIKVNGKMVTSPVFTIGALARALGRSVKAIRLWESKGIIPETPLRDAKGDRQYTPELVETIRKTLEAQGRLGERGKKANTHKAKNYVVQRSGGDIEIVPMFRIGVLARAAERSVVTLLQLESKGYLPTTPFRSKGGVGSKEGLRLYTKEMIESVRGAMKKRVWEIRGEEEWGHFAAEISFGWSAQGVEGSLILGPVDNATASAPEDEDKDNE